MKCCFRHFEYSSESNTHSWSPPPPKTCLLVKAGGREDNDKHELWKQTTRARKLAQSVIYLLHMYENLGLIPRTHVSWEWRRMFIISALGRSRLVDSWS